MYSSFLDNLAREVHFCSFKRLPWKEERPHTRKGGNGNPVSALTQFFTADLKTDGNFKMSLEGREEGKAGGRDRQRKPLGLSYEGIHGCTCGEARQPGTDWEGRRKKEIL